MFQTTLQIQCNDIIEVAKKNAMPADVRCCFPSFCPSNFNHRLTLPCLQHPDYHKLVPPDDKVIANHFFLLARCLFQVRKTCFSLDKRFIRVLTRTMKEQ